LKTTNNFNLIIKNQKVRTEIMFRRINTEDLPLSWHCYAKDESYLKTLSLYKKSFEYEREGNVEGFTDTYLQAINLQSKASQSIPSKSSCPFEVSLPWNLYRYICTYLSFSEIIKTFTVSKIWAEFFRDGRIWFGYCFFLLLLFSFYN
jgi:hypothetical protein